MESQIEDTQASASRQQQPHRDLPADEDRPCLTFVNRYFWPDNSATSQILTDVAFDLAARGHRVRVITSRLGYADSRQSYPAREDKDNVEIIRVATSRFGRHNLVGRAVDYMTFYVSAFFCALRRGGWNTVFIAKTDPPLISVPVAIAARLTGASHANWLQDVYPEVAAELGVGFAGGRSGNIIAGLRNWSLRVGTVNIAIGTRMKELLEKNGIPASRIEIIPNWSDDETIYPVPHAQNEVRAEWGLADKFVIAYSGNMGRAHDVETVLGAAAILQDDPSIRFVFIGGGKLLDTLRARREEHGLSNIDLKPYQPREKLAQSLSAADVHWLSLQPALEGTIVPSKAYGIAAAGRPMIFVGDADGEIARLIDEHECGIVVAPGESELLAEKIRMLAADAPARTRMGDNARRLIDRHYSRASAFAKWRNLADRLEASVDGTAPLGEAQVQPKSL